MKLYPFDPGRLVVIGLMVTFSLTGSSRGEEDEQAIKKVTLSGLPLGKALKKARAGGKYEMLLRQIKVSQDAGQYADFRDAGLREVKEYAGFTDLPKGYWVYVHPYWYIWRDLSATPKVKRAWGPEQATGPPDTHQAGDIQTAWASLTPDGQDEWLLLEYAEPVVPEAVLVYETYNPGALNRVTVFKLDGEEVEVWKGKDPTPTTSGMGVSEVKFRVPFKTNRVRIHLDSKHVPGWNEIDAVGLRDTAGKTHWAVSAEASSTYAQQGVMVMPAAPQGIVLRAVPVMPAAPRVVVPAPVPMQPPAGPAPPQPAPIQPPAVPAPPRVAPVPAPPPPAPVPAVPGQAQPAPPQPAPPAERNKPLEDRIKRLEEEVRELKAMVKELKELLKKKP